MKSRRTIIAVTGAAITGALAGCSELPPVNSQDTDQPSENQDGGILTGGQQTAGDGTGPSPSITWSEEWLGGRNYRLSVDVSLNGAEKIMFTRIGSETPFATVRTSGTHTIAGPETSHGPIRIGLVRANRPSDLEYATMTPVDSYGVGSQEEVSFPLFLSGVSGSTVPTEAELGGSVTKSFENTGSVPPFELTIPQPYIDYYENRERLSDYGAYVSDSYDDEYLQTVVDYFEQHTQDTSDLRIINNMMEFVQNLEYTDDLVSSGFNEYPKFPIETLAERDGDCEDTCILLSSLLSRFGYDTVLLGHWEESHMSLGLAGEDGIPGTSYEQDGTNYYYVETTAPGWSIGETPPNLEGASAEIIPVQNNPVLVFSYAVGVGTEGGATVEASVRNVGDAPTSAARFGVEFQDRDRNTTASATSDRLTLPPGTETTVNVYGEPPDDRDQRVKTLVTLDGEIHDTLVSDYQESNQPP